MKNFKDFPEEVINHPLIKVNEISLKGETFLIVNYSYFPNELLNKFPSVKETRGNVYRKDNGECTSRSFPKFFNLNEIQETLFENLPWHEEIEITEKIDGSIVTPLVVKDSVFYKSKKSFISDLALDASKNSYPKLNELCFYCHEYLLTPIFEYTSPFFGIVIDYGHKPKFTLLAIRENETGNFISREKLEKIASLFSIPLVTSFPKKGIEEIKKDMYESINFEGYVVYFLQSKIHVKFKTLWYLKNHMIKTELRERDFAEAVVEQTSDELKSLIKTKGYSLDVLEGIEKKVLSELNYINENVSSKVEKYKDLTNKEVAFLEKENIFFPLLMIVRNGREPNIKEFWKKHYLKNYSLQCPYNPSFSG